MNPYWEIQPGDWVELVGDPVNVWLVRKFKDEWASPVTQKAYVDWEPSNNSSHYQPSRWVRLSQLRKLCEMEVIARSV